jgi:hypothetical protein
MLERVGPRQMEIAGRIPIRLGTRLDRHYGPCFPGRELLIHEEMVLRAATAEKGVPCAGHAAIGEEALGAWVEDIAVPALSPVFQGSEYIAFGLGEALLNPHQVVHIAVG